VLDGLLREREELLSTLDRVAALHRTARLIRQSVGVHAGFVAELDSPEQAVIRWMSGNRTDSLQDLEVPVGQGIGGRVLALGKPVRVNDYVSSQTITHQFDAQVRGEGLAAMVAVPIISRSGDKVDIAISDCRQVAPVNDQVALAFGTIGLHALVPLRTAWHRSNGIGSEVPQPVDAGGVARTGGVQHALRCLVFSRPEHRAENQKAALCAIKRFVRR